MWELYLDLIEGYLNSGIYVDADHPRYVGYLFDLVFFLLVLLHMGMVSFFFLKKKKLSLLYFLGLVLANAAGFEIIFAKVKDISESIRVLGGGVIRANAVPVIPLLFANLLMVVIFWLFYLYLFKGAADRPLNQRSPVG
jgi:hypothetical protein